MIISLERPIFDFQKNYKYLKCYCSALVVNIISFFAIRFTSLKLLNTLNCIFKLTIKKYFIYSARFFLLLCDNFYGV